MLARILCGPNDVGCDFDCMTIDQFRDSELSNNFFEIFGVFVKVVEALEWCVQELDFYWIQKSSEVKEVVSIAGEFYRN